MANNSKVLYALSCGHAAPGPATLVNGPLVCAWHQTQKSIVGVIEYEWHAKCNNCTFSRWAGLSKHNAGVFANGHCSREPAHKVTVEYARNPVAVRTTDKFREWRRRMAG